MLKNLFLKEQDRNGGNKKEYNTYLNIKKDNWIVHTSYYSCHLKLF